MNVDFHIHSRYSDGGKTVEDIIKICKENDIDFISITDHNSFLSYKELQKSNIRFITGMEIDTKYKNHVLHMLLYNFNCESIIIKKYKQQNRNHEIKCFKLMIEELEIKHNIKLNEKLVKNFIKDNNYFDKTRLNDLIVLSGFVGNPTDSFNKYTKDLKEHKRYIINMKKLFEIEKESNGLVSLAHPLHYNMDIDTIKDIILDLKNTFNLRVVEAINNRQTLEEEKILIDFCNKNDLFISGGSDAHYKFGAKPGKVIGIVHDKKIKIERVNFLNLIMKDNMKEKLKKYFTKKEIEQLFKGLESKQRANIINEKYFAKIGKNTNKLFYTNLVKEINLYNQNKGNKNLPNIIDSYIDDESCLLVLDNINGQVLGTTRNEFDLKLSEKIRFDISKSILNIKNINITFSLDKDYSRKEKLDKYFEKSLKYLEVNAINKIKDIYEEVIKEDSNYVLSHGDLISPNIMICNKKILLIDWEFIALKPEYYDLAYFLLFSKENNSLDIVKKFKFDINIKELYKDGIIICLKEIQNWAKLFGTVEDDLVNKKINRWKQELNNILEVY